MRAPLTIFFSGAGLSEESGVPTFRTRGGIWERYDVSKVCNWTTFSRGVHRAETFEFYNLRRVQLAGVEPNDAHRAMVRIARELGADRVRHVTQNVDDLLERAGATDVMHVHGRIRWMRCLACEYEWEIGCVAIDMDAPCVACGVSGSTKPAVVFFSEPAPAYGPLHDLLHGLARGDTLVVVGTSGSVIPIHGMARRLRTAGIRTILVDPAAPAIDSTNYETVFACGAVEGMRAVEAMLLSFSGEKQGVRSK